MKNGCVVDELGNKCWFKDAELHREDGPAIEHLNGSKEWYKDGKLHREDGPAAEFADGRKYWHFHGIYAGEGDKPDTELWARLTSLEANGGPLVNGLVVLSNGDKHWYKDDQRHREDGPAIEWASGYLHWYFNDEFLGRGTQDFWELWDRLTDEQRANPTLLRWMPR